MADEIMQLVGDFGDAEPDISWMDAEGGFNHALDLIHAFTALKKQGWKFIPPDPEAARD